METLDLLIEWAAARYHGWRSKKAQAGGIEDSLYRPRTIDTPRYYPRTIEQPFYQSRTRFDRPRTPKGFDW